MCLIYFATVANNFATYSDEISKWAKNPKQKEFGMATNKLKEKGDL